MLNSYVIVKVKVSLLFIVPTENTEHTSNNLSGYRYLQADPEHFDLQDLKCKFDVILLEPPLEEYYRESGISHTERFWTWDDVCPPT